jgi:hypothetical protein
VATSDIVGIIIAPPDEETEMRFPRPPMVPGGSETNNNQSNSNSNGNIGIGNNSSKSNSGATNGSGRSSRSKPPSGKQSGGLVSSESWDDLDDLLDAATVNGGDDQSENGRKEFNYKASTNKGTGSGRHQSNMSSSNRVTSESNHYAAETYREANRDYLQHSGSTGTPSKAASGMKLGGDHFSSGGSSKSNLSGHNSVDSLPDSVKSSNGVGSATTTKRTAAAPSPVGDDFFATFGI